MGGQIADGGGDADAQPVIDAPADAARACVNDRECCSRSICTDGRCGPCPDPSSCPTPLNQEALRRNGCATCEFAPASQCAAPADCTPGLACVRGSPLRAGVHRALVLREHVRRARLQGACPGRLRDALRQLPRVHDVHRLEVSVPGRELGVRGGLHEPRLRCRLHALTASRRRMKRLSPAAARGS